MTNIVIATAALTLTITVPAGAMVSVLENGEKKATITAETHSTTEAKPVERVNVVVDLSPSAQFRSVEVTGREPSPSPTPTITLSIPSPSPSSPTPVQPAINNSSSNVPQPTINNFTNVPQASPANYSNSIPNTSPAPTQNQELEQLRQEVAQLRLAMQQRTTPAPSPTPQNTITEATIINPATNLPIQRTVTVQRVNVTPTPVPTSRPVTNNSLPSQPRTTTAAVGAVPSASSAQIIP